MNLVILDTGCGNLFSVSAAISRLGYQPIISHDAKIILQADKLFLPGVGTAQAAMNQLNKRGLISLIKACTKPVLGICLGMQLLAQTSDENNGISTLGIIDVPVTHIIDIGLPLPHIGWNQVKQQTGHPLFRDINEKAFFYFVHSYAMPICTATIAHASYGAPFSAAIEHNNFFGVQFHPERSGAAGQQLLKNFLEM
ncbi:imidazole glycerol phosphate synthase subunit HisH [Candidatus Steffania adelgidicola]|uniref:imidazole glycerol phosphate synthase subunit HisH n=1 Tax=Candidatus Steffania adelgidicola TaxID=1076626 RepID=UPI001D0189BA|nr:imidazole glycerol phosphate synthase subunit HisH [Candidatus Steffania adelgidicola]UDG80166.1 Imidazole glycerol phosphate synthase subunit HisH [Candidatus Steffania adelgidicola]